MDPNYLLNNLKESNRLLNEVLHDADIVSSALERAEVRIVESNAKYATLRRFVCAALMADLQRQAEEKRVEDMLRELLPDEKPAEAWDVFDHLLAHYAELSRTYVEGEDNDGGQEAAVEGFSDVDMTLSYPADPSNAMSVGSSPPESLRAAQMDGNSDVEEGPSSAPSRRAKGKEPERRSPRFKRQGDDSTPVTVKKTKYGA